MTIYLIITFALLGYPILTYFLVRQTINKVKVHKTISLTLLIFNAMTIFGVLTKTITISEIVNYFLLTLLYFSVSFFLWLVFYTAQRIPKQLARYSMFFVFGIAGALATIGFFILLIFSIELTPSQNISLTDRIIFKERNICSGPDPAVCLKRIEVYKRYNWLPIIAHRIAYKEYDNWERDLGQEINAVFDEKTGTLLLKNKDFLEPEHGMVFDSYNNWADTLQVE